MASSEADDLEINWRNELASMTVVAGALSRLCALIVRHVHDNLPLDGEALEILKLEALSELRNSDGFGISSDAEAKVFRKAADNFLKLADIAFARGKESHH